jgi:hypothetical protein
MSKRAFLYSPDCPGGRIFAGDEAIAAACKDGWADSPAGVGEKPAKPASGGKKKKAAKGDNSK